MQPSTETMKQYDGFSIKRFILLARYYLIHNKKHFLLQLVSYAGILFIAQLLIHSTNSFNPAKFEDLYKLFLIFFMAGVLIFIGASFPAFRFKERNQVYLMIPASHAEKYLTEFVFRPLLYVIVMPLVFWLTYLLEGYFVDIIFKLDRPDFVPLPILQKLRESIDWNKQGFVVVWLLIFGLLIPFTGASIFRKNAAGKTYLIVIIWLLVNYFLINLAGKAMNIDQLSGGDPLWLKSGEDAAVFFSIYGTFLCTGMLVAGYFKLKEKEV